MLKNMEKQTLKNLQDWLPALKVVRPMNADQTAQAAREAVKDGHDLIIGGGGDGTINALLESLVGSEAVLGIIPFGTGNSLARELGLPNHPLEAVTAMQEGKIVDVSVGLADDSYFGLMIGIGFDGLAVRKVSVPLKRFLGKIAYVWAGLVTLARYRFPSVRVTINGEHFTGTTVIIAKSRYYASRFPIAPQVSLKNPDFQVLTFKSSSPWRYLVYVLAVILNRHTRLSDITVRMAKEVTVEATPGVQAHMDGEPLSKVPSFVRISSQRLRVLSAGSALS